MQALENLEDVGRDRPVSERVEDLIRSYADRPLLSTTGTEAAIGELAMRYRMLEQAIREIALEVNRLRDGA